MQINKPTPNSPNPELAPYILIGGEVKVRALVDRFYDLMDELPDYFGIRKLHPESLTDSREKLFMFLTGWLGGRRCTRTHTVTLDCVRGTCHLR